MIRHAIQTASPFNRTATRVAASITRGASRSEDGRRDDEAEDVA